MQKKITPRFSLPLVSILNLPVFRFSLAILIIILAAFVQVKAAVGVTTTGANPLTISADLAANSTSPVGGQYTAIGTITISENSNAPSEFGANNTIEVNAPTGWVFYALPPHGVSITSSQTSPGNLFISVSQPTVTPTKISFTYSGAVSNRQESLSVAGILIRANTGASAPETVNVTVTALTPVPGLPTNALTINQVAGAARKLDFTTQPGSSVVGMALAPAPTVIVLDQFDNSITSGPGASAMISLAIESALPPGGALLPAVPTVTAVNGMATFPGVSINSPGRYTLRATSGTLIPASSASFAVENPQPILTSLSKICSTQGDNQDLRVTLTGENFVPGAVVRISYFGIFNGFVPESVSADGKTIEAIVPAFYLQLFPAGEYDIQVVNPAPAVANGVSNALMFTVYPIITTGAIAGSTSVCAGAANVVYSVTAAADEDATYNWQLPANATIVAGANTNSITVNFNNATSGVISVTAVNGCGVAGNTSTLNVTVNPNPTVSISTSAATFCDGGSVLLTANATGSGSITYQWQKDGSVAPGVSNNATYSATETGTYRVLVTSNTCTTVSNSIAVRGLQIPRATIIPPGTITICEGQTITLAANGPPSGSTDIYTYQWRNGTANISGATGRTYTVSLAGSYSVVVTNSGICASEPSAPVVINVNPAPAQPVVPNAARCGPGVLSLAVTNPQENLTYRWYDSPVPNASPITTGSTYSPNLTQSKTYYVSAVSDQGRGCESINRTAVQAQVSPLPAAVILPEDPQCLNLNGTNTFVLNGRADNGTFLEWKIESGSDIAQITAGRNSLTPTVSVRSVGTVRVSLTVVSNLNCGSATEFIDLVVNPVPNWVPEALSVQRCGPGVVTLKATGAPTNTDTYHWYNSNGDLVTTGDTYSPTITQTSGIVFYYVAAANATSCENRTRSVVAVVIEEQQTNAIANINIIENSGLAAFTRTVFEAVPVVGGNAYTYRWFVGYGGNPPQQVNESSARLTLPPDSVPFDVAIDVQAVQIVPTGLCFDVLASPLRSAISISPLPVELLYLKADKKENGLVVVAWSTAMEKNSEGFEVQVSQDAKNYRSLGFVASQNGNSTQKQTYTFHDKENGKYGTRYYRLKQVDLDGTSEFFGPKAVKMGDLVESISAYPNPFSSEITLEINAEEAGTAHVTIHNAVGSKVLERTLQVQKGMNKQELQLNAGLPLGVYTITTRINGRVSHFKLLKQ